MKRMIALVAVTIPVVIAALMLPGMVDGSLAGVEVVLAGQNRYCETIYASGKVEEITKSEISCDIPVVPKEVLVSVGDQVKTGQVLATVDVQKTKQAIISMASLSEYLSEDIVSVMAGINVDTSMLETVIPKEIKADYFGTVSDINLTSGVVLNPTEKACVISNLSKLRAKINIPEKYADKVKENQQVDLKVSALDDRVYNGIVSVVFPAAHQTLVGTSQETVVNIYVDIADQDDAIKSGYSVTGQIRIGEEQMLNTVPYEAVNQDETGQEYVYCYQNGKAVRENITTGVELEHAVEITSEFDKNKYIIADYTKVKKDGSYVKIVGVREP